MLALQETKLEDAKFPTAALEAAGYHSAFSGQKTYNGVALLARAPIVDVEHGIAGFDDPQRRILSATVGDVRFVNLYVVNGQAVGSEKYAYKLDWLAKVTTFLGEEIRRHPRLVVMLIGRTDRNWLAGFDGLLRGEAHAPRLRSRPCRPASARCRLC